MITLDEREEWETDNSMYSLRASTSSRCENTFTFVYYIRHMTHSAQNREIIMYFWKHYRQWSALWCAAVYLLVYAAIIRTMMWM